MCYLGRVTYRFSYVMPHNDVCGWGSAITDDVKKLRKKLSNLKVYILQFASLIFIKPSMEKCHLSIKKVVKNLQN